eukprot:524666-Pleurochrysis_carterae.AAC.2
MGESEGDSEVEPKNETAARTMVGSATRTVISRSAVGYLPCLPAAPALLGSPRARREVASARRPSSGT